MPQTLTGPRQTGAPIPYRFDPGELSGSLGDLGTFLPLSLAMCLATGMNLTTILLLAGVMNIVTGWVMRQPIPVQPMKAIAAVAIAEGLTAGEVTASGIWMGALLLSIALGPIDRIAAVVPKPLVRGIQAGVGLKLAWHGLHNLGTLPWDAADGLLPGMGVLALLMVFGRGRRPVLLWVFGGGLAWVLGVHAAEIAPFSGLNWTAPAAALDSTTWWNGLVHGALPQLPLTLLNSVIAVCALSADYFPGHAVPPRKMALSVALLNLTLTPLGAMPACHGSGGLAAQYRFGARTGGSPILLGTLLIFAGLTLGAGSLVLVAAYPAAILGPMLVLAGWQLARAAGDMRRVTASHQVVCALTVVAILWTNTGVGFGVGLATFLLVGACRAGQRRWLGKDQRAPADGKDALSLSRR